MHKPFANRFGVSTSLVGVAIAVGVMANPKPESTQQPAESEVPGIQNYREWTLANPKPYFVYGPRAAMCAAPSVTKPKGKSVPVDPHQDKWIRVFVNEMGRTPLLEQKVPAFPPGAVIVKEKLKEQTSDKPELLTVMVKRAAGFDTENGDWEYYTFSGDAKKVHASGKLKNCQSCHIPQKENGYVFRDYLPEEERRALK